MYHNFSINYILTLLKKSYLWNAIWYLYNSVYYRNILYIYGLYINVNSMASMNLEIEKLYYLHSFFLKIFRHFLQYFLTVIIILQQKYDYSWKIYWGDEAAWCRTRATHGGPWAVERAREPLFSVVLASAGSVGFLSPPFKVTVWPAAGWAMSRAGGGNQTGVDHSQPWSRSLLEVVEES